MSDTIGLPTGRRGMAAQFTRQAFLAADNLAGVLVTSSCRPFWTTQHIRCTGAAFFISANRGPESVQMISDSDVCLPLFFADTFFVTR